MARGLLDAIGLSSMECIKRYPACDYGAFADIAGKHAHEKPAYCCFFSEKVNDRTRPCNSATDFYSNNMTSTRPILSASTITTIFAHGEGSHATTITIILCNSLIMETDSSLRYARSE